MIPPRPTRGESHHRVGRGPGRLPIACRAPRPSPATGRCPPSSHPSRCSTFPASWVVIMAVVVLIVGKLTDNAGQGAKPEAVLHAGAGRILALAFDGDDAKLAAAVVHS